MTTVRELTDLEIEGRLATVNLPPDYTPQQLFHKVMNDVEEAESAALLEKTETRYRYVRPLTEAADSLIEYLQNADGRIMTGLREIDVMTRGFGAGELVYVTGYTTSGKTQLFLTTLLHNRDKPCILFTADEPAELVLTKLIAMLTRSNAERMEERVKAHDEEACARVRRVARHDFANLIIVDQAMSLAQMTDAVKEAEDYWGCVVAAVGFDYLELLRSDSPEVERKSQEVKAWAMNQAFPSIFLHQGSRGNSAGGQSLTLRSMRFGGESEALMVLGVRRARDREEGFTPIEADTVDVSLLKNKRPPSKLGEHRYYLDPENGMILPLNADPNAMEHASDARVRAGGF